MTCSTEERVATISITRPPANALSSKLLEELDSILDEIKANDEIRVVVIRGEGKFFSAGADIKEFTEVKSEDDSFALSQNGQKVLERIENFQKPVIAVIHGAALGGGLELAMACHIRLVSEDAKLGLPELSLGIIPGFAGTQRLPLYVGTARSLEMMLTSEPITGKEAVGYGLANHVYPENELLDKAYILARKIAQQSPITVKAIISLQSFTKTERFESGMKREAELFGKTFATNDAKEGIEAFLEKRKPVFKGK
nr:enoyl-CoA hydratase [Bacillus sp. B15-48]